MDFLSRDRDLLFRALDLVFSRKRDKGIFNLGQSYLDDEMLRNATDTYIFNFN